MKTVVKSLNQVLYTVQHDVCNILYFYVTDSTVGFFILMSHKCDKPIALAYSRHQNETATFESHNLVGTLVYMQSTI